MVLPTIQHECAPGLDGSAVLREAAASEPETSGVLISNDESGSQIHESAVFVEHEAIEMIGAWINAEGISGGKVIEKHGGFAGDNELVDREGSRELLSGGAVQREGFLTGGLDQD